MSAWPRRPRSVPCPGKEECGGSMVACSGGWGSGSVGPGPCPFTQSPSGFMEKKNEKCECTTHALRARAHGTLARTIPVNISLHQFGSAYISLSGHVLEGHAQKTSEQLDPDVSLRVTSAGSWRGTVGGDGKSCCSASVCGRSHMEWSWHERRLAPSAVTTCRQEAFARRASRGVLRLPPPPRSKTTSNACPRFHFI